MTIRNNKTSRSPYTYGDEPAYDLENVSLTGKDYNPTDDNGNAVTCRGFIITGTTGTINIKTQGGTASVIIPSGLTAGVEYGISFVTIYSASTTATGIVALT